MKTALVITAPHCTQQTYDWLCSQLTAHFGPLQFTHQQKPEVLGGFMVQMDGIVYDCTMRTRLAQLREYLGAGKERA